MPGAITWTRRKFLVSAAAAVLAKAQAAANGPGEFARSYRVNAAILVLGVPIFKRDNAGAGRIRLEHGAEGLLLELLAGSLPERTRGLNRFGAIRENILMESGRLRQTAYTGFMTSSPEGSLEQARSALSPNGATPIRCSFSCGSSNEGRTQVTKSHFLIPPDRRWSDAPSVLASGEGEHAADVETEAQAQGPTPTFLYSVYCAIQDAALHRRQRFCHNGEMRELITTKKDLTLAGTVLDAKGAKASEFTLWLDASEAIPRRIEFRAKSYLRLTFEAV